MHQNNAVSRSKFSFAKLELSFSEILGTSMPSWMIASDRIVGGQKAKKSIPWQVSIRKCNDLEFFLESMNMANCHFCGGTILDEYTVLSAAHCFNKGGSVKGYSIMAGHKNRKKKKQVCTFYVYA